MTVMFKMSCGCILRSKDVGKIKSRIVCKSHESHLVSKITKCIDCGCDVDCGKTGRNRKRCPKCVKATDKKRHQVIYRRHHPKKKKVQPVAVTTKVGAVCKKKVPLCRAKVQYHRRGDYCKMVLSCLKGAKVLKCAGCGKFVAKMKGADPDRLTLMSY